MIQEIKDFINQNIKENGKGGITGTILNSVLNKIADALPSSASAGLKNLVDGEADGSVRGVNAAENSETYVIGKNSHAEGTGTKAGSEDWIANAHAEGRETHAAGNEAHAEGVGTYAWHQDHAEGGYTRAEGIFSHAEGASSVAKGFISHAEGEYTKALSRSCHAEGCYTKAGSEDDPSYSTEAHAEGKYTHADGNQAHAEGYSTYATHQAHAEGNYTRAEAESSHAEGSYTVTKRYAAHAEGHGTQAGSDNGYNGYAAHAEGHTTKAIADYSHAEGRDTEASSDAAHAEGHTTKASGYAAHAEGSRTEASGSYSHAEGLATKAIGYYSHAGGCDTIAKGDCQTAIGIYNKEIDAYFSVGDGKGSDKRSDAFRVEKDSKVMIKNNAGEEVHLQDFEPRSCIIRWQPQSEIKDEMYFLYHDLVYMPMFDNLQDGERHILHLDWLYEHQVALDDAERTDGGSVEYIGGERLHSVLTVRKYAGNMYCELTTKVVETTRRNDDAHQNRFHTPQIRYNYADDRTHTRASRVYLQDYIFSERFNYDGENAVGTHFKLTLVSALLDGSPVPLTQFVFADNTGNVDYYRDEEGNENSNATSDGRYVYNADSVGDTDISIKVRAGDKTQTSKFTLNGLISDHEITIDVPEQDVDVIKELEAANLLGAMQGKSVCRQTTADGNVVMATILRKDDSSLEGSSNFDKCMLVFGYAGMDVNKAKIEEFGELTVDLYKENIMSYSGTCKDELKVKIYGGKSGEQTISIMSNCKANEFRALYLKSSVQIDAKQTEPLLTFNVPASKGYITAVVADSSVQGLSTYINQVASVAEQIADKLPYANPFYYSDYSTDYYDAETQTLTLLEGKTMAHIYPTEPLMVKHIVLPEVKTGQRLAIYGNWIPVVEDGDEQEGRFSSAWRTDVANGFEDLIYLNGQWINKA